MDDKPTSKQSRIASKDGAVATAPDLLDILKAIPEDDVWLADRKSKHTRRAYRDAVADSSGATTSVNRQTSGASPSPPSARGNFAMERDGFKPASIRSRLSALSSLFKHLVEKRAADVNPVREISRPNVDRLHGTTASFSQKEARKILDVPDQTGVQSLRDRAILAIGLYAGCRRSEIAGLTVGSLHTTQGHDELRYTLKPGREHVVVIHGNAAKRIEECLAAAGHSHDTEGPLFRSIRNNTRGRQALRRHLNPDVIDRIVRKYAKKALKKRRGYSAHSMRATFITNALQNGASLEDVQQAVGHADPATTKRYDRRGFNAEKAASFFANY